MHDSDFVSYHVPTSYLLQRVTYLNYWLFHNNEWSSYKYFIPNTIRVNLKIIVKYYNPTYSVLMSSKKGQITGKIKHL